MKPPQSLRPQPGLRPDKEYILRAVASFSDASVSVSEHTRSVVNHLKGADVE